MLRFGGNEIRVVFLLFSSADSRLMLINRTLHESIKRKRGLCAARFVPRAIKSLKSEGHAAKSLLASMAYKQIYSPLYDKKKWMALIFIKNLALALQQQLFGLKVIAYIESRAFAATRMTRQT